MLDCPEAEFVKQDIATLIDITLIPMLINVFLLEGKTPLLELLPVVDKVPILKSAIVIKVQTLEHEPVLVVLAKVLQQMAEFTARNKFFVAMRALAFGCNEGSDHGWFNLEQLVQFENITDPLLHFSQAQVWVCV